MEEREFAQMLREAEAEMLTVMRRPAPDKDLILREETVRVRGLKYCRDCRAVLILGCCPQCD